MRPVKAEPKAHGEAVRRQHAIFIQTLRRSNSTFAAADKCVRVGGGAKFFGIDRPPKAVGQTQRTGSEKGSFASADLNV